MKDETKQMKVAIIGATGYSGVELIRILQQHPHVEIHSLHTSSQQGQKVTQSYPHLQSVVTHTLEDIKPKEMAREVDLVFTSTPSGVSSELVPKLLAAGLRVIDLSGDHRLKDKETYQEWYGLEPAQASVLEEAVYGLTEYVEEDLTNVQMVANPGCFATAVLLGLLPVIKQQVVAKDSVIIDAKTGVSGAGRGASSATHYSETNDNIKIYRVNDHQHTPEIEQMLKNYDQTMQPITFSPHLVSMTRGIMATMYANVQGGMHAEDLFQLYKEQYEEHPFVRVRALGEYPSTKEVYGSNFCDLAIAYDERTKRMTIITVIDNLMKGAAGQAVQNMNKMLGLDEQAGLMFLPIYP